MIVFLNICMYVIGEGRDGFVVKGVSLGYVRRFFYVVGIWIGGMFCL